MYPAPFYLTAAVPALPAFSVLCSALHSLTQRLLQVTGQMPDFVHPAPGSCGSLS